MFGNEEKIKGAIADILREQGVEFVEFKIFSSGLKHTVRCLVDYPAGGITLNTCAMINTRIFSFLDSTQLLGDDFTVEVNSPGLDRKLVSYRDFLRVKGKNVGVWLLEPLEGKTYVEGEVTDVNEQHLFLKGRENIFKIDLVKIRSGKEKVEV